jgi:hypothetical protein
MCLALSGFVGQTLASADALIVAEQYDDIAEVDQGFDFTVAAGIHDTAVIAILVIRLKQPYHHQH